MSTEPRTQSQQDTRALQMLADDWALKGNHPAVNPYDPTEIAERDVYRKCAAALASVVQSSSRGDSGAEQALRALTVAVGRVAFTHRWADEHARWVSGLSPDEAVLCDAHRAALAALAEVKP